jgi:hypothetical protein
MEATALSACHFGLNTGPLWSKSEPPPESAKNLRE